MIHYTDLNSNETPNGGLKWQKHRISTRILRMVITEED